MAQKQQKKIVIYTDGACSGNPGPGGWGAYLIYEGKSKKIFGSDPDTTNNRMEMKAAIEALKLLKFRCNVELHTDSVYLKNGITLWIEKWVRNNWYVNKKLVKNVDLWQDLLEITKAHDISWYWVKGHSDNAGNNIADGLACQGKEKAKEMLKCPS